MGLVAKAGQSLVGHGLFTACLKFGSSWIEGPCLMGVFLANHPLSRGNDPWQFALGLGTGSSFQDEGGENGLVVWKYILCYK